MAARKKPVAPTPPKNARARALQSLTKLRADLDALAPALAMLDWDRIDVNGLVIAVDIARAEIEW